MMLWQKNKGGKSTTRVRGRKRPSAPPLPPRTDTKPPRSRSVLHNPRS